MKRKREREIKIRRIAEAVYCRYGCMGCLFVKRYEPASYWGIVRTMLGRTCAKLPEATAFSCSGCNLFGYKRYLCYRLQIYKAIYPIKQGIYGKSNYQLV